MISVCNMKKEDIKLPDQHPEQKHILQHIKTSLLQLRGLAQNEIKRNQEFLESVADGKNEEMNEIFQAAEHMYLVKQLEKEQKKKNRSIESIKEETERLNALMEKYNEVPK